MSTPKDTDASKNADTKLADATNSSSASVSEIPFKMYNIAELLLITKSQIAFYARALYANTHPLGCYYTFTLSKFVYDHATNTLIHYYVAQLIVFPTPQSTHWTILKQFWLKVNDPARMERDVIFGLLWDLRWEVSNFHGCILGDEVSGAR
ncbi:hypothetical protein P280DRAFT_509946 [Massarina eburnea CBS 473.64]|uniref:Uncharacterized protein n=1 Tax=Massarina eburnea CBS 473.64 TaxID=1395130 RepID=A0A6A6RPA7_9PLEO|nr:hypothetical protein P280DRAFT_509946 [Massarina eburnea CBS 473.64]